MFFIKRQGRIIGIFVSKLIILYLPYEKILSFHPVIGHNGIGVRLLPAR